MPLNILQSLEAPAGGFDDAAEDLRDEIASIATGLLGLVGIEADPLQSREAILLANLIEAAWRKGQSLSLESLIPAVADPPMEKLGALPLETIYPRKDRQALMMRLNNLLASPSFEAWRSGQPLDVERLLRAPDGRPRLSVVYTAHLSDAERLFVTALLLEKVKTWMRRQGGTTQLRAVLYMDEVFGYFPPHPANPATKKPLLTLLKQARAQGVSVVLATQNPVDLDYKGLSNMGTWLVSGMYGHIQEPNASSGPALSTGLTAAGVPAALVTSVLDRLKQDADLLHLGVRYNLGNPGHHVTLAWNRLNDKRAANADTTSYGVAYTYPLSKRTNLNAVLTRFVNSGTGQAAPGGNGYLGGVTASAGKDSTSLALGIRHVF